MAELSKASVDCGCCAGVDSETPRHVHNIPGLPAISYRTGTHARFKESLLARLSSSAQPALRGLSTRDDSDFTIALCDAFATALDVLSFYQERIANEHYLRTATERLSVLGMARLIGYELAPGVAASTYLAFSLQEAPGEPAQAASPVTIPVGTRVQSVPGQDEKAQTFETVEALEARVEWNAIPVQASEPWRPAAGDTHLWLKGVSTQLQPGDAILLVGAERETDSGSERWDVRVSDAVEADAANDRTRIVWTEGLGSVWSSPEPTVEAVRVFALRQRAALFGHNAPDPNLLNDEGSNLNVLIDKSSDSGPKKTLSSAESFDLDAPAEKSSQPSVSKAEGHAAADQSEASDWKWKDYEIHPKRIDLDAAYPRIIAGSWFVLVSNKDVGLYRAERVSQVSRSDFGLSTRVSRLEPDPDEDIPPENFSLRDTLVLAQSEELRVARRPLAHPVYGDSVALEGRFGRLRPGQAVAVSGKRQRIAIRGDAANLKLRLDDGVERPLNEGDSLILLEAPVRLARSTPGYLSPECFSTLLEQNGTETLRLRVEDRDGHPGHLDAKTSQLALDGARKDDPVVAEIAFIATSSDAVTDDRDRTHLKLSSPLAHCYERATARLGANVARATHGETVEEILGGGDARRPDQSFVLRHSPLTYVSASTPSGRAATLSLRINDLLWSEAPSLYSRAADERIYTLEQDDDAHTTVRFGDGAEGARPPSGQNNVRARYRKGLGVGGNVAADTLTTLLSRPLGVSGVRNPEAASGGEDPETFVRARENAPLTVLTLDRAVSVKDYADFARAFAGIDKAHALWVPAGPGRGVFLTVAGVDGAAVPAGTDTHQNLQAALKSLGDPLVPVRVASYRPAVFRLRLAAKVAGDCKTDTVLDAVERALREAFGFGARAFGQGVSLDEVVAVAHAVSGVEAVHVSRLYRADLRFRRWRQQRLSAALPVASLEALPEAAELLTLAEGPLELDALP